MTEYTHITLRLSKPNLVKKQQQQKTKQQQQKKKNTKKNIRLVGVKVFSLVDFLQYIIMLFCLFSQSIQYFCS